MRGSRVGGSPQACATANRRNRSRACGGAISGRGSRWWSGGYVEDAAEAHQQETSQQSSDRPDRAKHPRERGAPRRPSQEPDRERDWPSGVVAFHLATRQPVRAKGSAVHFFATTSKRGIRMNVMVRAVSSMAKAATTVFLCSALPVATLSARANNCFITVPKSMSEERCECSGEIVPRCGLFERRLQIKQWYECVGGQETGYRVCETRMISPGTIADCERNWNNARVMVCLLIIAAAVPICSAACTAIVPCLECAAAAGVISGLVGWLGCDLLEGCDPVNVRNLDPVPMTVAASGECPI